MTKKISILFFALALVFNACAQKKGKQKKGHHIQFEVEGLSNEKALLAYYFNGKHYISDTIFLDEMGKGALKGDTLKEKGVYILVLPSLGNKYFDFIISDQHFGVKTNKDDLLGKLAFTHSPENDLFQKDMKEMGELTSKIKKMQQELASIKDEKAKKAKQEEIKTINDAFLAKREQRAEDHPNFFYSDLLNLMRNIDIPEPPKKANGELIDSSFAWNYWKYHYWDYTNFAEPGILRTPVYHRKLLEFVEKRTLPIQDSIIKSCRLVIDKARANDDVFQTTLVTLLNKYANSKVMGDDAVYVALVNAYYKTGLASWTDSTQLAKMIERADALEPLLIGKKSPNLTLRDTSLRMKFRLHDLPSDYTIVFVWDPECGHCKKMAPVLRDFYEKYKQKSILVYAISTVNHLEVDKWKAFVKENNLRFINVADPYVETNFRKIYDISSTPQIFVLDKNKNIIAKRIGAEQLEEFFYNYFKHKDKAKFKGMENLTFEHKKEEKH